MRTLLAAAAAAVVAALVLSGCSSDPDPTVLAQAEPTWITPDPAVLAEGTFPWHKTDASLDGALEYYALASQTVAHPCVWESDTGEEVYFNNLKLPTGRAGQGLGPWSGNLTLMLDWTDQDWVGTALRAAYMAPGVEGWQETPAIGRGETLTVPVKARSSNETADDDVATNWSLWLCFAADSVEPQQPFVGSVQAKVVFAPDPVPASELDAAEP
jgi:hypothetical protein